MRKVLGMENQDFPLFLKTALITVTLQIHVMEKIQNGYLGAYEWFAENLSYLPDVVEGKTGSTSEPYCYVYGYDTSVHEAKENNYKNFGVLYNWPAAMSYCRKAGIYQVMKSGNNWNYFWACRRKTWKT